jgi:hypothetical protein
VTSENSETRQQLDVLQAQLASRDSTVHFAHSGVALIVALIFGGSAVKLFLDAVRTPVLGLLAAGVTLVLVVYALVHYLRAWRCLREELTRFEQLKALRRALKLDDPSALLPG